MKTIKFTPLRIIKKTGKITVASYIQWHKIKSADYGKFNLIIDSEYKKINPSQYVYNHKGEQLFWFNHTEPEKIPLNYIDLESIARTFGEHILEEFEGEMYKFTEPLSNGFHWSVRGFDCDGVPVFSHYSTEYIATNYEDISVFEPLTVKMVTMWFGWFLYQLQNSNLQIK